MYYAVSAPRLKEDVLIDLPASKSLSNRALIMQALCDRPCQLTHLSDCDDTAVMLRAFETIQSAPASAGPLTIDIGAAGTSMRFLTAYFASRQGAEVIMTGSERMRQRPIALLVDALRQLGAEIEYTENEGCPPLRIHGRHLAGGALSIDGSVSSQYISALLMIAPTLTRGLQLTLTGAVTSVPYIEMTLGMMREFGVTSDWDHSANVITIAPQTYQSQTYEVESDWSASSYWYEILALAKDIRSIRLKGLHETSFQGDAAIRNFFGYLGIETQFTPEGVCLIKHECNMPREVVIDMVSQPDLAQTVIATYCAKDLQFEISGLHTLRIKETDRVAALENELAKLGYVVKDETIERATGKGETIRMMYQGSQRYDFAEAEDNPLIATYKDHRMAMAFAPLCLALPTGEIRIDDPDVVSKSYPSYWEHLKQIGFEITEG